MINIRSLALNPSGGEPTGQVSYSQGMVRTVGVAVDEPVPDMFSAGHDNTTCILKRLTMVQASDRQLRRTSNPASVNSLYCARICATAHPSSLVSRRFLARATETHDRATAARKTVKPRILAYPARRNR